MTKKINPDDHLVSQIVREFRDRNKYYPTLTKITACFNITIGLFRLCCVCGDKKELIRACNKFHKELLKEIDMLFEHKNDS